jgi:hypothetical protein
MIFKVADKPWGPSGGCRATALCSFACRLGEVMVNHARATMEDLWQ